MKMMMMMMRMVKQHHFFSAHALFLIFLVTYPRLLLSLSSYSITSATWTWRGRYPIAYEQATRRRVVVSNDDDDDNDASAPLTTEMSTDSNATTMTTPVLLLNGFGVGTFHQHRLIHELLTAKQNENNNNNNNNMVVVYCIDYLGQGKSWPRDCNDGIGQDEVGLQYSGNTWVDQVTDFIRHVVLKDDDESDKENNDNNSSSSKRKLHVVGNSVGGHLATFVAARLGPRLIKSLVLLNPTPLWGFNVPGWNGVLPAPRIPKVIGRWLFDQIRDLKNIELFLSQVYANHHAFDETLMQQIRACTNVPGGHAAFASILWSPPVSITVPSSSSSTTTGCSDRENTEDKLTTTITINTFYDCLAFLANNNNNSRNNTTSNLPILLVFGHSDPWCKPALARRMLEQAPKARYIEMTNVGHCPNHEAPIATAHILNAWWQLQQQHYSTSSDSSVAASQAQRQRQQRQPPLLRLLPNDDDGATTSIISIQESWGTTTLQEKIRDEISLNLIDRLTTAFV
jgi:pimeloyl-ACP methyl ester carboxylesterase